MSVLIGAVLVLLGAASAPSSAPKPGDAAPVLAAKDVKDRALAVPEAGSVMVLSFASKATGEKAGDVTRAVRVQHPEVKILSFVDLSGFPVFMRGIVKGQIAKRQAGAVQAAKDAFVKAGKVPPDDLDANLHIIPDFDAAYCKAYGAKDTGNQAAIVVIGGDGLVKAFFANTPTAADVNAAIEK